MAQDKYYGVPVALSDPANEAIPIVPGTNQASTDFRSLYVGVGGDVSMKGSDDAEFRLWKNVPSGTTLPFRVAQVQVAGTTATNMLGLK